MSFAKRQLEYQADYGDEIEVAGASVPTDYVVGDNSAIDRKPRLTNIYDLPEPLVQAVMNDKYSPGRSDYTTSQLAGTPARQWALKRKHWMEITEDVRVVVRSTGTLGGGVPGAAPMKISCLIVHVYRILLAREDLCYLPTTDINLLLHAP